MSVTLKTITQLLDLKSDVRGVIRHGQLLANKAAKKVFHLEAFTGYDIEVRERAARAGPVAFGSVCQEEVLSHFCYDNTVKARQQSKVPSNSTKKADRACLRLNNSVHTIH